MTPRYGLLTLFLLVPALALAQPVPDSLLVRIGGEEHPGWAANFGARFDSVMSIGPLPVVVVEADTTDAEFGETPAHGCRPLVNASEVDGNIALIERGTCLFVDKVRNASAAGAAAVVIYNCYHPGDGCGYRDSLVWMGGECTADEGCDSPALFVSHNSGLAILNELDFGEEAEIIPVRVMLPPASASLDTETIQTTLFADGFIGHHPGFDLGEGLTFNGDDGLSVGTVLIGIGGEVTSNPYDGGSEFTALQDPVLLEAPFDPPFQWYEQGVRTVFSSPLGVEVTLTGYAGTEPIHEDHIAFDLQVENTSGSELEDIYLGVFADFDSGITPFDDAGGFEESLNLVYVFDPAEPSPYFGVSIYSESDLSGYSLDATSGTDAELFEALTSANPPDSDPAGRAAVAGVGPFDIAEGETRGIQFAFVAGDDELDLIVNTQSLFIIIDSVEDTMPKGDVRLGAVYPNPLSSEATVDFALSEAQVVRLTVYDVLGRKVAVLAEGVRPAGEQTVTLDAVGLPSGVYIVRLDVDGVHLTQRLTVVR